MWRRAANLYGVSCVRVWLFIFVLALHTLQYAAVRSVPYSAYNTSVRLECFAVCQLAKNEGLKILLNTSFCLMNSCIDLFRKFWRTWFQCGNLSWTVFVSNRLYCNHRNCEYLTKYIYFLIFWLSMKTAEISRVRLLRIIAPPFFDNCNGFFSSLI